MEGRRQFRGTIILSTMSAIALISSSQLIRVSLLLPEALEMLIRTHITCAVRVYTSWWTNSTTLYTTLITSQHSKHCSVELLLREFTHTVTLPWTGSRMSTQCFEITQAMPGYARACRRLCLALYCSPYIPMTCHPPYQPLTSTCMLMTQPCTHRTTMLW